jgi:ribonuclease J
VLSLQFYGGHYEIGGTKLLLRGDEGAVFLDFGKSFDIEGRYFDEPWNTPYHIPSLLSIGALPDLPGLYRTDRGEPPVNGVLVSHVHLDHVGYVPFLSPSIPVYTGEDTRNLLEIRLEAQRDTWTTVRDHLDWRTFRTGDEVTLEGTDIRFRPVHVDHSVPASYGFVLEAGGRRIAYTGDLRLHGRHARMTDDFLAEMAGKPLDVLVCEGTRVDPPGGDPDDELVRRMETVYRERMGEDAPQMEKLDCASEAEVQTHLRKVISESEKLVLVEVSPLDMDRMWSVWLAARESGRRLVLPARQAYMMQQAGLRTSIRDVVTADGSCLLLSQRRMDKRDRGGEQAEDAEEFTKGRDRWERELPEAWQEAGGSVLWGLDGRAELRQSGSRYVVCAPQVVHILPELCYRAAPCPIDFILSKSEPFSEEMLFSFDKLLHWLALYGCRRYYQVHVSGHASANEIGEMIEKANPSVLVPVHTKHPELFTAWHDNVLIPPRTAGERLVLE